MLSLHGQMVKMVFNNSNIGPRIKRYETIPNTIVSVRFAHRLM